MAHYRLPTTDSLENFRKEFELHLKNDLHSRSSSILLEPLAYSLFSGGKRLRPWMLIETGKALQPTHPFQKSASALEYFHTFTLIHDDLPCLDNDDTRRGQPSLHKKYDEATALLCGDYLSTLSNQLLWEENPASHGVFLQAFLKVIEGQQRERLVTDSTLPILEEIFRQKTGALFALCFQIPFARVFPQHPKVADFALNLGTEFGVFFQWLDDLDDDWEKLPSTSLHLKKFFPSKTAAENQYRENLEAFRKKIAAQLQQLSTDDSIRPALERFGRLWTESFLPLLNLRERR